MAFDFNKQDDIFHLKIDDQARAHLLEMVRWARFVGILFALITVLSCVVVFVALSMQPSLSGMSMAVPEIITSIFIIAINFYPIFALIRFGSLIRSGLNTQNQLEFNRGLKMLRTFFMYIGIMIILTIIFYGFVVFAAFAYRG